MSFFVHQNPRQTSEAFNTAGPRQPWRAALKINRSKPQAALRLPSALSLGDPLTNATLRQDVLSGIAPVRSEPRSRCRPIKDGRPATTPRDRGSKAVVSQPVF